MVILTDYKESVDIGWYQMSSSTDEPDDLVQAGIDEFQNYENQFLKDENAEFARLSQDRTFENLSFSDIKEPSFLPLPGQSKH